jgi:hypothetical protein
MPGHTFAIAALRLSSTCLLACAACSCGSDTTSRTAAPATPSSQPIAASPTTSATPPCVRVGGNIREPRKVHDRQVVMPELVGTLRSHPGPFVYDATISVSGRVTNLRLVRPTSLTPPWPRIEKAFRTAIADWEYEPTLVGGQAVPVCLNITVRIEVR